MTNKRTKKEEEEEADAADKAARAANLNYNSPAELDPNSEASKQRDPLPVKWWHDASHSADATRLAQQRARDEAAGMAEPKGDDK